MPAGLITAVVPGSLAGRIGFRSGDQLLSINGHPLRDVIDVRFYVGEAHLDVQLLRDGEEFAVAAERAYDELLGLEFAESTFGNQAPQLAQGTQPEP